MLGNYVRYAIDVRGPDDITAGLRFAKKFGIRLVVRNTGHDYLGKSTGAGALALWTHHLKEIEYISEYSGAHEWRGAAMRLGAGVQGFEAFGAAAKNGVVVVGGECDTVGIAGGYTQGGGHSALNNRFGLAADQVLEWEVVTADGNLRVANPGKNEELYWALSGGGGGTYGVVTKVTVKAHPDAVTTAAKIAWTHDGSSEMVEKWWDAVKFYWLLTPNMTDAGAFSVDVYSTGSFMLSPWFAHGLTRTESMALLSPLLEKLEELGLQHTVNITEYSGYLPAFKGMFDYIAVGIAQYGGRLIPRQLLVEQPDRVLETIRRIVEEGSLIFDIVSHPSLEVAGFPDNAVLPAWRDNQLNLAITM
jgi:FAD/FMN-containing dehydrogenase